MERIYGKVEPTHDSSFSYPGFTLGNVIDIINCMHTNDFSLYDVVGDAAIEEKLLFDLVMRIQELENQLNGKSTPSN